MNSYADVDNGIQLTPVAASGGPEPDLITGENEPPADPVVPQVKAACLGSSKIRSCIKHWTRSWQKPWPEILFTKFEPRLERVNIKDVLAGSAVDIGHS
jgi:hypothetical protein